MIDRFLNWLAFITFVSFWLVVLTWYTLSTPVSHTKRFVATIQPHKRRLFYSLTIISFCPFVPVLVIVLLFTNDLVLILGLSILFFVVMGFLTFIYQPTFTLSYDGTYIERLGFWNRADTKKIALNRLDKGRIRNQNPGKGMGIVFLYSLEGEKLLTLGLDENQLSQLFAFESKVPDS
ncbi:MAG: hypothetical protein JXA13_11620 [Anaerolineales bacterium]|nr:hypothetical protein [Anaerolineales bacterium]